MTGKSAAAGEADLAVLDLFAGIESQVLRVLVGGLARRPIQVGGGWAISEGDAACAVLLRGRLALDFDASGSALRTIGLVEEGDVLVRPGSGGGSSPALRCRAIEESEVLLVDAATLARWMTVPQLAANVVRVLSAQVADRELAISIALETRVERRLLLKVRQLAERFGRVTPEGVRLDLRLTHQQLAEMVGAVRESVTIALRSLAEQGILEVRNRTILLLRNDIDA